MTKALYDVLKSVLWFYEKLREDLVVDGFVVNDYNPCVANKMINSDQMTVMWNVDDLKVSHKDEAEIDKFTDFLQDKYEKPQQGLMLTYHCGKVHDYLGINLDYSRTKKLKVSMIKCTSKIFKGFSEELGTSMADPVTSYLFIMQEERHDKYLSEEKAQGFHKVITQPLFLWNWAR